jgi:hypothetical protein
MKLHKLYFGDFMQIDGLDAFPGIMVPNGIKLPPEKDGEKSEKHKQNGIDKHFHIVRKEPLFSPSRTATVFDVPGAENA